MGAVSGRSTLRLAALCLACLATLGAERRGEWRLWESPFGGTERLDQKQLQGDPAQRELVEPTRPVGQVFVPTRSPLVRFDVRTSNRYDSRPGQVLLFEWKGSREESVREPPLFEDVVAMAGDVGFRIQPFFPRPPVEVEPGNPYYVEFRAQGRGEYSLLALRDRSDSYARGEVVRSRKGKKGLHTDLWFRTFSSPEDAADTAEPEAPPPAAEWSEPPASRPVSLDAALERARTYALHRRPSLPNTCKDEMVRDVLLEAVLYKASCHAGQCEKHHARQVRKLLLSSHDWRFCRGARGDATGPDCKTRCTPEPNLDFGWLPDPAAAYLLTRESGVFDSADHERIRKLLADSAQRLWARQEVGAQNRAFALALGFRLVADLFPGEPQADAWRRYADGVWDEFLARKDTLEDSAEYNRIGSLPVLLQYASLTGQDDAVWSDPDFRAYVDRFFDLVTPMGAAPSFGDSYGWSREPSAMIWLFEKAAARWQAPEYRWLAQRMLTYHFQRMRDAPPRGDSLYQSLSYLVLAWLDADRSLEPRQPRGLREEPRASQTTEEGGSELARPGSPIGQTFLAGAEPLVRIDLRSAGEPKAPPPMFSLYAWRGGAEATRAEAPLFRGRMEAQDAHRLSVFPFLELASGRPYYFEVEPEAGQIGLRSAGRDAFAGGSLVAGDTERDRDLWFATYALAGRGSSLIQRAAVDQIPKIDWGKGPKRDWVFREGRIDEKIVLRSGFDEGFYAIVNLLNGYAHGQPELGALTSLVDGGSVILPGAPFPYADHLNQLEDENVPVVRRYWNGSPAAPGREAQVTHFADARGVTIASLEFQDPEGWGVSQERRLIFVKNRFLLVRDRFTFPEAMSIAAGPVWHAGNLEREHGDNWWEVSYREPLSNIWKVRNPERYALLWFTPRPGHQPEAFLERSYLPGPECASDGADQVTGPCRAGPAFVVADRWRGDVEAGQTLWFDTLILPHGAETPFGHAAEGVRVIQAAGNSLALEVRVADETWTVLDNPTAALLTAEGFESDARVAILRTSAATSPYVFTEHATHLVRGGTSLRWPVRTSVERGAGDGPPARLDPGPGTRPSPGQGSGR